VCRSLDHFITNSKQLVYKTSFIYEHRVNVCPPSLPTTALPSPYAKRRKVRRGPLGSQNCHPRYPLRINIRAQLRGRKLIRGSRFLTSRWTLTLTFWCLLSTRHTPVSWSHSMHGVHGRTVQTPTSSYELTLAVWGGVVARKNDCRFYTPSA